MGLWFSCFWNAKRPAAVAPHQLIPPRANFGYATDFHAKYKLGKQLGHGQFGRTLLALQICTQKQVAVKVLDKRKMGDSAAVNDAKREVNILTDLAGHENIVQLFEAFEDYNFVYIVMELCQGGGLLDRISSKKKGRYSEKDAANVVRQMLNIVAHLHLLGIVHRDLKPENFLYVSEQEDSALKVIDFGLSNYIRPGRFFRDIVGSPFYVAPEVLRKHSGPEADVWSVGVIMYILLCGRQPFSDKTEGGIYQKVLRERPDFLKEPWPSISAGAKDLVQKMLTKNPRLRITAGKALSHPWIRDGDAPDVPLDIKVLSNIRDFVKYNRLKKIALQALTSLLDVEEVTHLQDQFNAIDTDRDGMITLPEMQRALAKDKPWKLQDANVSEVLHAMDTDGDGKVNFEEFAAAALHIHQLEHTQDWQVRLRAAFEKIDMDKDGFITPEELKLYMGTNDSIDKLIDEADIDKDGRISLHEFQLLLQGSHISW